MAYRWTLGVMLALAWGNAPAKDDLDAMNAVSQAWDAYVAASSADDPDAARWLAPSSIAEYAFVRDAALYASAHQVKRLPLTKRIEVYLFRARYAPAALDAMDGEAVARACIEAGVCGIAAREEGQPPLALAHVTLVTPDLAIGELAPPSGNYHFGPELVRIDGAWKVRDESLVLNDSAMANQAVRSNGLEEDDVVAAFLADMLDTDTPPSLALLDQPLRDDRAARTRLNERWPDYDAHMKTRIGALERKAESGEDLAMMVLGAIIYSGRFPELAPQDTARGMQLMEEASAAGNVRASSLLVEALTGDAAPKPGEVPTEHYLRRLARHARLAANAGDAEAMSVTGNLIFNGAAGQARDCVEAESWLARAEDAGLEYARNERVWFLAACPIPAQRDPARAMALAQHLVENADALSPFELDTVAATFAANGEFQAAADFQARAVAGMPDDAGADLEEMRAREALYARGKDFVQDYSVYERAAR
ncbi:hypothetical protein [Marilutibacter aestuarii]|uniref:Sel1 repeat family protein n=1 Tax=Marilutibacter aestuarii TaxID=1706195 RepID=A0A508A081_9GAMM|nr:hypothetical protein [Lysobacter aestuarii]TQD39222.1 hypothetical protein FKV25_15455 [Lysobacter aestuarii]